MAAAPSIMNEGPLLDWDSGLAGRAAAPRGEFRRTASLLSLCPVRTFSIGASFPFGALGPARSGRRGARIGLSARHYPSRPTRARAKKSKMDIQAAKMEKTRAQSRESAGKIRPRYFWHAGQ
jgi:hypothetical protein